MSFAYCPYPYTISATVMLLHNRYVFGNRNFEVVQTAPHVFQTAKPVDGFLYEFYVTPSTRPASSALTVREIDPESGAGLELLDCTALVRSQVLLPI